MFNGPTLGMAAVLFVILVSVDFFLPLRQLGSYFHVAMNGMTSTKRIFALLDEPDRAYGDRQLPQGALDVTTCDLASRMPNPRVRRCMMSH